MLDTSFDEPERILDNIFNTLPILKFPVDRGIFLCLFEFELKMLHRNITTLMSSRDEIIHHKNGLKLLIPQIYLRSPKVNVKDLKNIKSDYILRTEQALNYCNRYSHFEHAYKFGHWGWYLGIVDDHMLTFTYPPNHNFGVGQLNEALHEYFEYKMVKRAELSNRLPPRTLSSKIRRLLSILLERSPDNFLWEISDEIYNYFHQILIAGLPEPSIDLDIKVSSYTLEEYHNFWLAFATLMLIQSTSARQRSELGEPDYKIIMDNILLTNIESLCNLINRYLKMPAEKIKDMLLELVLNINTPNPDILIQPLFPISCNQLLVSPTLIHTANWELCLFRNWIQRYEVLYTRTVIQKKKSLSNKIATLFRNNRYIVETDRIINNKNGMEPGDVDLAIFDNQEGSLALFEVKWILEADSTNEIRSAEDQISKGISQTLRNKRNFNNNPQSFLDRVFVGNSVSVENVKSLIVGVIGYGDIGGNHLQIDDIYILSHDLLIETLEEQEGNALSLIIAEVANKQNTFANIIAAQEVVLSIKAGGYLLRIPGWGPKLTENPKKKLYRTFPCSCGSGLKYKDCCSKLEIFPENYIQ